MYNSNFKYYTKMLLGRKNEMWYFDNWNKIYYNKSSSFLKDFDWSKNFLVSELTGNKKNHNPIFHETLNLRLKLIENNYLLLDKEKTTILLHFPPLSFSPAAHTWMINFKTAMMHMGVKIKTFWEDLTIDNLSDVDYIIGIGAKYITDLVNWDIIKEAKKKFPFKIILQTTFDVENETHAKAFIKNYQNLGVDYFFSFDSKEFNIASGLNDLFSKLNTFLFSIEFSANPLLHFPPEFINPIYDYIFLGSSNYDKIERYNSFFPSIVKQFNGVIAGPGWDWSSNFVYSSVRDRELYSMSKIAINIHLTTQIKLNRQLNERAYIIAAYGIPQVTDNAAIINSKFPRIGLVANNANEFNDAMLTILNDNNLSHTLAINALLDTYKFHTTFDRCSTFLSDLKKIANA